jgi:hypothetical protein
MKVEREFLLLLAPAIYLFILPLARTTALRSIGFGVSVLMILGRSSNAMGHTSLVRESAQQRQTVIFNRRHC